jgi:signal peptidase I
MKSQKASFKRSFGLFFLAVAAFMALRWGLYEPFVIPSGSMIPTLLVNDHILVAKYAFGFRWPFTSRWLAAPSWPERGDVVVFRSVEQDDYYLIKRVVGLPGDTIEFTDAGELVVNGAILNSEIKDMPSDWSEAEIQDNPVSYTYRREKIGQHQHGVLLEKNGYRYTEPKHVVAEGHLFVMGDNRDHSRDSRFWGELPLERLLGRAGWVWLSCSETVSNINFLCDPRHIRWQRTFHRIE